MEPDIWALVPVLSVLIGLYIIAELFRYMNNRREEQMEKQFTKLLAKYEPYILSILFRDLYALKRDMYTVSHELAFYSL